MPGCVRLIHYSKKEQEEKIHLVFAGIAECLHRLGIFIVNWFVSFKFWETVRHLDYYLEITKRKPAPGSVGNSNELYTSSKSQHENKKKMLYRGKVAGLLVVSTAVIVRSCLTYFLQRRLKVLNEGYSESYLLFICINDMIILIGYSICLCLIIGALKRLDRLLNDEAFWGG